MKKKLLPDISFKEAQLFAKGLILFCLKMDATSLTHTEKGFFHKGTMTKYGDWSITVKRTKKP